MTDTKKKVPVDARSDAKKRSDREAQDKRDSDRVHMYRESDKQEYLVPPYMVDDCLSRGFVKGKRPVPKTDEEVEAEKKKASEPKSTPNSPTVAGLEKLADPEE